MHMRRFLLPTGVIVFLILVAVPLTMIFLYQTEETHPARLKITKEDAAQETLARPSFVGETITYDVNLGMVKVGEAVYQHLPAKMLNGKNTQFMRFETQLANFRDTELIYSDPETFLPLQVERDISKVLLQEKITETYDQERFTVTIVKHSGKTPEERVIRKKSPLNNPILLPQYVRQLPELKIGMTVNAAFPRKEFVLTLTGTEEIKVPAGKFKAFKFTSTPRQIEIWISADERRIPLKIKGTGLLGYYMVMRSYTEPPDKKPQ